MSEISRRAFLRAVPIAAAGGLVVSCREQPYRPSGFTRPAGSDVALLPADSYGGDLGELIGRGLAELGFAVRGRRVLLKPNLVEYETGRAINTNAAVIAGAVEAFRRAGAASVVVGEGAGHRRDAEYLVSSTGLLDRLRDLDVPFVDLNHDDVRPVRLATRFMRLEELALPVSLLDADVVVSMPKLKTHHWAGMTCSLKNLFGAVPGAVYGWPKNLLHVRGIENAIVDLAATIRPALAIVDGIVGMEGDGPIMGIPRSVGFIAMGTDPVAVDATCARVMGFVPERLTYLSMAGGFLGNVDGERITQRGERIERYATSFAVVPHHAPLLASASAHTNPSRRGAPDGEGTSHWPAGQ